MFLESAYAFADFGLLFGIQTSVFLQSFSHLNFCNHSDTLKETAKTSINDSALCQRESSETSTPTMQGGSTSGTASLKSTLGLHQEFINIHIFDPVIALLGIYHKEIRDAQRCSSKHYL